MLDSDQEPSYNLLKNLLLLPRILKLIEDIVNDSTPLLYCRVVGALLRPKFNMTNEDSGKNSFPHFDGLPPTYC